MNRLLLLAPITLLAVSLTACGGEDAPEQAPLAISKADLEEQVASRFTPTKKAGPLTVTCPDGLRKAVDAETDCTGTSGDKRVGLEVTTTKVSGDDVEYDVTPFVPAADVAGTIVSSLEMQGYQGVGGRCSGDLLGEVGQHVDCTITTEGGETDVDVDVTDVNGWLVDFTFKS